MFDVVDAQFLEDAVCGGEGKGEEEEGRGMHFDLRRGNEQIWVEWYEGWK